MMYVFILWAAPLLVFWGWYFLSYYDINFGYAMLSRQANDMVFQIYGDILNIDPQIIPGLAARACVIDTLIILAIWAFRRRARIAAYIRARRARYSESVLPNA